MGRYASAARKASDLTNKQLATEIAALSPMNRETLQDLLPRKRDKQTFLALMKLVEQEKHMDENVAYLRENLESAGKVVFKLLRFLT